MPLTETLSLFARFGVHYPESANGVPSALSDPQRFGRVYGWGLSFQPTRRIELRAESERLTGLGNDRGQEANTLMFGARVEF